MIDKFVILFAEYAASYGYLIAFVASLLENSVFLGLLVPGEIITLLSGFYAGQNILSYPIIIIIIVTSSVVGDNIGFLLGRHKGKKWLKKIGPKFGYREEKMLRAEEFWQKHGEKAILAGRFMAFARTFVPFFAGASNIKHRRFLMWDILGASVHSLLMVTLGYYFGENWETISTTFGTIGVVVLAIFLVFLYKFFIRKGVEKIEE